MKIKSSFLFLIILVTSTLLFSQNGSVKSYYPDHKLKSELSYVNDILDGSAVWYHPNGKVMMEKNYSKGIINGWVREYFENGQLKSEYNVRNGVRDGDEKKYYEDGTLREILSYLEGKLNKMQNFDAIPEQFAITKNENTPPVQITRASSVKDSSIKKVVLETHIDKKNEPEISKPLPKIEEVFTPPAIVGNIFSIQDKIIYPDDALKYGLEGTVRLKVTIDEKGNVIKTEVLKNLGLGCDDIAISAVKQGRYIPATRNGKNVESELIIDLSFRLPIKKQEIINEETVVAEAPKQIKKYDENLSVMCEADRCPRPEDDIETIYSRFQIPNVAKALKLRGMILIEGIVDKNGKFDQTKIIDGVGYGCDQLVEAALQKSKFTTGIKKGEPVETKALINFPFSYDH